MAENINYFPKPWTTLRAASPFALIGLGSEERVMIRTVLAMSVTALLSTAAIAKEAVQ